MPLLSLLPTIATFAGTHYIAHYNTSGDHARLQGRLPGCRKILFRFTVAGSVLAIVVVKPLSDFSHYSESLMLTMLVCALFGFGGAFATALSQGLGWFKRLALVGFLGMGLRVLSGMVHHPEMAVGGNGHPRLGLRAAGQPRPADLAKRIVAARRPGFALES